MTDRASWKAQRVLLAASAALVLLFLLAACKYETLAGGPVSSAATATAGNRVPTQKALPPQAEAARRPTPIPCRLSDLTPSATWEATSAGLAGTLVLTNYWDTACTLQGQPTLGITDANGFVPRMELSGPPGDPLKASLVLNKNAAAVIRFTWTNYCSAQLSGDLRITVAAAGQKAATLYVLVEDPNGKPRGDVPPCRNKDQPSVFSVDKMRLD